MVSDHTIRFASLMRRFWGDASGNILAARNLGTMATIYQLSDRLSQSASSAAGNAATDDRTTGRSATIILFTGVRYERWTDAGDTAAQDAIEEPWTQGPASGTSQR
jgi:hypothetical protein